MHAWNQELIREIYDKKNREKSEDRDNLLELTSKRLYGEKIHYALELIQNAEDEGSSSITFIFNQESVIIINDGRPFDSEDVWAICSVKPRRKKNKIGFFGIGFKSVFNITNEPQIISGEYNFRIKNYIYPEAVNTIPPDLGVYFQREKGAIFILPHGEGLPEPKELIEYFQQIDEKLLLFLESIQELNFIDNIKNERWSVRKNVVNGYHRAYKY